MSRLALNSRTAWWSCSRSRVSLPALTFPPSTGPRPFQSGPRPDLNVDEMARMCPKSENVAARELWIAHKTLLAELPTIQLVGELVGDLVSRVRR